MTPQILLLSCLIALPGIDSATSPSAAAEVDVVAAAVGTMPDGTVIEQYTLTNALQTEVRVLTYGATLTGVLLPDRDGRIQNVTLHLDTCADYLRGHPLFGSVVGRYANRIAGGAFEIDGQRFELTKNMGPHQIHGGTDGFHRINWRARPVRLDDRAGVELAHTSPDGHEGYPGTLEVRVRYLLTNGNELVMDYWARTDRPTHLNVTNHAYWNLAGAGSGNVLDHVVQINANQVVVANAQRFPTGELRDVAGTALDFRVPCRVGDRIDQVEDQNYDDCYVLQKEERHELALAARVVDPRSGRGMEVYTTQPGVQFYTAKGLGGQAGGGGATYGPYHGLCLETQHFPDSPNHPHFPTTLLRPGEAFHEITLHRFWTQRPVAGQ